MNDKIAIALFSVFHIRGGTGSASDQSPRFCCLASFLKDRQHGICVVLLIYPSSPGPDHKLINIHSVWCINLPENDHNDPLKICDGNRFSQPVISSCLLTTGHNPVSFPVHQYLLSLIRTAFRESMTSMVSPSSTRTTRP